MIRNELKKMVTRTLNVESSSVKIERSADKAYGNYTTNIAMVCAKKAGESPRALAQKFVQNIHEEKNSMIEKVEIAGSGFINFFLQDRVVFEEALKIGVDIRDGLPFIKKEKMNLEFISANPTGKLHIGHGRGAFYGDALARILAYAGAKVTREFYINDSRESKQIIELGKTALGLGEQYLTENLKSQILNLKSEIEKLENVPSRAGFLLAEKIEKENEDFITNTLGIPFDVWYSEDKKMRASGIAEELFNELVERGFAYEKDGAWWLKTSEYGDDEDRVVKRSDRTFSYFLTDIAYHKEKFERGYNKVIDVWGADHHGHVKRMQAVKKMLGWKSDFLIFITQLVTLKEGGEIKKMSKRAGTAVLLEELVHEVGIDALRWFYLEKALGTHMEFDAELAKKQSAENPVYYVQYAHARICSIVENIQGKISDESSLFDMTTLTARSLAFKIIHFAEVVEEVANDYQVHKLTTYAYELAAIFSQFYHDVRILRDDGTYNNGALTLATLTSAVIKQTLSLLGISAPTKM